MEKFSLERDGSTLTLHISEELDHHMAVQVSRMVDTQIDKGNLKSLIFDFSGMTFMDSSGIGMVLGRYRYIESSGRQDHGDGRNFQQQHFENRNSLCRFRREPDGQGRKVQRKEEYKSAERGGHRRGRWRNLHQQLELSDHGK